jgi:formylglycine-generating enzyme required for sulfatase activity
MKKLIFTMGFTALMSGAALNAQVTIGQDKSPEPFSVLELISNETRGLRLPQLTQKERNALSLTFAGRETEALGLEIFNINSKCVETWNGVEWIQACDGVPPLVINPPPHYTSTCRDEPECLALDGFTVTPLADIDSVFTANNVNFIMKPVTGGVFYMGNQTTLPSSNPNYATDGNTYVVHQVGLSSFYMSETEVTQGLYEAVMGSGNHGSWTSYGTGSTHPAYYVSWYDAIAFCNKLSLLCGKTPVYTVDGISDWETLTYATIPTDNDANWNNATMDRTKNGFRLPTEAEWEYAARGGQKNEYTRTLGVSGTQSLYSGGSLTTLVNTVGDVAWYSVNASSTSHQVQTKARNELGLYDMSGNVWEWCWDWYQNSYTSCCDVNPAGPAGPLSNRVLRGGDWINSASDCRVSYRITFSPFYRSTYYGFRVVCK